MSWGQAKVSSLFNITGTTVIFPNTYWEKNVTTGEVTSYYYLGDKMVALKKSTGAGPEYVSQDHLGSSSVSTDANGAIKSTNKFFPFGDRRNSSGVPGTGLGWRAYGWEVFSVL